MTHRRSSEIVVITGATAGVGRATAEAFAERDANLVLLARDAEALEAFAAELEGLWQVVVRTHTVDIADAEAVAQAAQDTVDEFGQIDVWVNNAMVTVFGPLSDLSAHDFRRVTEVTYLGFVHGTMAALDQMRLRDRGVVVQVGSALAYRAIPLQSAYCGAKHAIRGFTDAVRSELLHDNSSVRLTIVHLPAVNTPQFDWAASTMAGAPRPVAPVYEPEVAARAIVWAVDHPRREVYVGRMTLLSILANKVAPGLLDRYLARTAIQGQQRSQTGQRVANNLQVPQPGHRTRGSFSSEAKASGALRVTDRTGAVVGVALAATWMACRLVQRRMRRKNIVP
ncbi:MAG: SDR family oxidoreductase [Luteibacter sp.]|uniref:SDR family oxidoreductase n=1 Tax=Luteibacter sp. TaxID=1886636 RepID=UPI002806628B|nr:SDR family oxidoreductase [Luteibacter sp.]MDQ7995188.1 SDR family oxidoreductase [Luteibacter sp.]